MIVTYVDKRKRFKLARSSVCRGWSLELKIPVVKKLGLRSNMFILAQLCNNVIKN
jgi:hypothetical protein